MRFIIVFDGLFQNIIVRQSLESLRTVYALPHYSFVLSAFLVKRQVIDYSIVSLFRCFTD